MVCSVPCAQCPVLLLSLQVVLGRNGVESFLPLGPLSEYEQEVRHH